MFYRAINVVSSEYKEEEFKLIYDIGYNHQYKKSFLDNCFKLALKSANKTLVPAPTIEKARFKNILILPYYDNFVYVKNMLQKLNIKVIFNSKSNIKHFLIKNSPNNTQGGIYEVPCGACDDKYIGQTGRELDIRIKEHKKAVREADGRNAIFEHVKSHQHNINWNAAKIIINCNNYYKRNFIESAIIQYNITNLMNNSLGLFNIDKLTLNSIMSKGLGIAHE
jgi:hypothetical protein